MITYYKAYVHNGRLVLDEPTSLAEGELVELVWVEDVRNGGFDEAEPAALERELTAACDVEDVIDVTDALTELRAMVGPREEERERGK